MINNIILEKNNVDNSITSEDTNNLIKYWDILPNEVIEKIITNLDLKSFLTLRSLCKRNICIINRSSTLNPLQLCYFKTKQNKDLFADYYYDIPLNSIENTFITFIKNNLVTKEVLPQINSTVTKLNYYIIQYLLISLTQKSTYECKIIATINKSIFDEYETLMSLNKHKLCLTENNNTLLYVGNKFIYELKIEEEAVSISRNIISDTYWNPISVNKIFTKKQNIVVSFDFGETRFYHKIKDQYYDITPKSLYDKKNDFVGMQVDKQGNITYIFLRESTAILYYLPDNYITSKLINEPEHNFKRIEISDKNFKIYSAKISKTNGLMIFYGENTTSNKIEAHIYKYNIKIYTYIFNNLTVINAYRDYKLRSVLKDFLANPLNANSFSCSPKGNSFIIAEEISYHDKIKLTFYNVADNEVKQFECLEVNFDECCTNTIYYSNNGNSIFVQKRRNNGSTIVHLYPEGKITFYNIDDPYYYYTFNKSGCMFLGVNKNDNNSIITIYNFQNKEKVETMTLDSIHSIAMAKFSPNSQLLAINEIRIGLINTANGEIRFDYSVLVIYKIMDLDENNNLKLLPNPKRIIEYAGNPLSFINKFTFHPDGTKLILETTFRKARKSDTINIVELVVKP